MTTPVVMIHGYSDVPESFKKWETELEKRGFDVTTIHTCGYKSLTNEVSIKDIAEGFDQALRDRAGLNQDEPFDAIVHSTGMLVIRAWLTTYTRLEDSNGVSSNSVETRLEKRLMRLKRLIALAPASFGSPLAHKGRSWLGAVFKGNRKVGPDFMEAGDLVLDGLELGSRYTWELAHRDLLSDRVFYGPDSDTPYVFTFCGTDQYGGIQGLFTNPSGSDGTVRWAGCSLNTRKIVLNMTKPDGDQTPSRFDFGKWQTDKRANLQMPFIPIAGANHGSILADPPEQLIKLVANALRVTSQEEFNAWNSQAVTETTKAREGIKEQWQQFIVKAVDERGDPITDYFVQFLTAYKRNPDHLNRMDVDVHTYSGDKSLRCFHFNLNQLNLRNLARLRIEIIARSGTELVKYYGYLPKADQPTANKEASDTWTAVLDMDQLFNDPEKKLFNPFTTTLIELQLNRQPGKSVTYFIGSESVA